MTDRMTSVAPDHREFMGLSLASLAEARDLYHVQLLNHPQVIGTALGMYLIRYDEPWPKSEAEVHELLDAPPRPKEARQLDNSGIRPYSWPCVLVFVKEWIDYRSVSDGKVPPGTLLPQQLWLPDGRSVPICVVEAHPVDEKRLSAGVPEFRRTFVGSGFPVVSEVQGSTRIGTIGPIVTNGQHVFALTSRHALGDYGSPVDTIMNGQRVRIGTCYPQALTREAVSSVYTDFPLTRAYLNLDVGLIQIERLDDWTTAAFGIGAIGPIADARSQSLSLALVGAPVIARGAMSGEMDGQVKGLLFRYKSVGGIEYIADYLIGSGEAGHALGTKPGDSGTTWYLTPSKTDDDGPRPLAIQWGAEVLSSQKSSTPYALASSLATVCGLLDLDIVRDWNSSLFRYWGAVGHYSVALKAIEMIPSSDLRTLFTNNRDNITFPQGQITERETKGLSKRFVPLADVPDLAWKMGAGARGPRGRNPENPNHFADMDEPNSDGKTLLDICQNKDIALDPETWLTFYSDPAVGTDRFHQGLLPFRVWQIFDAMVEFAGEGQTTEFLCAAGVLAHYIGDACQPLHTSAYHDGDPSTTETRRIHHRSGEVEEREVPLGSGVHAAYENNMINRYVGDLFDGLASLTLTHSEPIGDGREAAWITIALMRKVIEALPPRTLIEGYLEAREGTARETADAMWESFGQATIKVLGLGVETLTTLWLSAWKAAEGEDSAHDLSPIDQEEIQDTVLPKEFLRSYTLDQIAGVLGAS
jgi:hypothetical protein